MHHHNQKLIERHGHQEAPKITKHGMFNYADYMDHKYMRKSEQLRAEAAESERGLRLPMDFSYLTQK